MKIVADKNIPFLKGVFEPYATVSYLDGESITSDSIADADALIIRTRTHCDEALLKGTNVRFIASATIGTDHVDTDYLKQSGIAFANAPGCNAGGVMQYVFTTLFAVSSRKNIGLEGKTIGVIGCGHTGSKVASLGRQMGFDVLVNDPPRALKEGYMENNDGLSSPFVMLDYLLRHSDVISCHVPLDNTTKSLASSHFFSLVKPGAVFINASRGEVVDDEVLVSASSSLAALILDVWNHEPAHISKKLLQLADIATPHIAGYSYEGKINGTTMVVREVARFFGLSDLEKYLPEYTPTPILEIPDDALKRKNLMAEKLLKLFPVYELDCALRQAPEDFEKIRKNYVYRREFKTF